jgi:hypothetical protein
MSDCNAACGQVGITAKQEGENDRAEVVIVFEPEGTSLMMGGLHPRVMKVSRWTDRRT